MSSAELGQPYGAGESFQQPFRANAPLAGASFALPMDGRWSSRVVSCVFTLTTSAVVANRYCTLEYQGGDGLAYCVNGAGVVVQASTVQRYAGSLERGTSEWAPGTDVFFPIDPVYIRGGDTLAVNVANMDAADTLTAIRFIFDRYSTDPMIDA